MKRRIYGDDLRTWAERAGISFARFGQFWATEILRVRTRVQIARACADFDQFSEMSENRETDSDAVEIGRRDTEADDPTGVIRLSTRFLSAR
jgi:hypothetical protein